MKKEEFEEKAHTFHGCRYDYSKLPSSFSTKSKVEIVCREHGSFWQKAGNHIYGRHTGCPLCGKDRTKQKLIRHFVVDTFSNKYGEYKILELLPYKKAKIRFSETGYECIATINNIIHKRVKDAFKPISHGVGFIGSQRVYGVNMKRTIAYQTWDNMISRCYDKRLHSKHQTYKHCAVCNEWHNFTIFKEWFDKNYVDGWCIDKDILIKSNKLYSPQSCCFVPNEINVLFTKRQNCRGELPIGVQYSESKKRYKAAFTKGGEKSFLGYYPTPEEAFQAYKKAKEAWIKEVANKWKDKLAPNVYEALMKYEVEITD